jgi:hypothetical protein
VCFAFDPAPGYPAWRVEKNRRLLAGYASAAREVCARLRAERRPIMRSAVLRAAGVPQSLGYLTPRANLVNIIECRGGAAVGAPLGPT